jgi:hypothetical protein
MGCSNKQQMFLCKAMWTRHFGATLIPFVWLFLSRYIILYAAPVSDIGYSYQNILRIIIWLFFLVVYSQAGMPLFGSRKLSKI